jgi:Xaa-Pro aminopeptidase
MTTDAMPAIPVRDLINSDRLAAELDAAGLDALIAASPENVFYLSGAFIRTQVSIRDRLALVVWPRRGEPTFIVCNIEESLARRDGSISDIRTYVEFAQSPIAALAEVLRERGLSSARIGIERKFLTAEYHDQLEESFPAEFTAADEAMERVRAIKTPGEVSRIREAFLKTEEAIRAAWAASRAGDTEKQIADRMVDEIAKRGADGLRHMTLAAGANTIHAHARPGNKRLMPGELLLTDFGGNWGGYNSDMARMGICGEPSAAIADEYRRYRDAYVRTLDVLRAGVVAREVFEFCARAFRANGIELTAPHIGHSLSRAGGHDNPILHPFNEQPLESGMLIALEPTFWASSERRYHLEDLVRVTAGEPEILTDWKGTAQMIRIAT